ncbi:rec, partial [Drosophila busckii]
MNTPFNARGCSRSVHGRSRVVGGYRPRYYFRRNGLVIPVGANGNNRGRQEQTQNPRGRKSLGCNFSRRVTRKHAGSLNCSFLLPENYAMPEDGVQVPCIKLDNPKSYPGWRLYFIHDPHTANSELEKRILAAQAHYQRNPLKYDIDSIRNSKAVPIIVGNIIHDDQLTTEWPTLQQNMCEQPLRTMAILGLAMHTVICNYRLDAANTMLTTTTEDYYKEHPNPIPKLYVRPVQFVPVELISQISTALVDTMIAVRGIVRDASDPIYLNWHAFRCTRCQTEQSLRQRGQYLPRPYHCLNQQCAAKDNFLALRKSTYTRVSVRQIIRLEESTLSSLTNYESKDTGEIDIELRQELVDTAHIGQEIIVTGVLKMRTLNAGTIQPTPTSFAAGYGYGAGDLQVYLLACSIQYTRDVQRQFNKCDLEAFALINAEPNCFKLFVHSLAPEVHGHELPKAACLLSLLTAGPSGGVHMLLVGDPGIGKSMVLQSCAQISERSVLINGKCASLAYNQLGVAFSGRNKQVMEAGGLMLAGSTGHCLIDGVDKLASKQSLLLQSMQAGQLGMFLPGTYACLDTHTSIIGCANPQRGRYEQSRYLLQNIRLSAALLKEFHLIYVLLDNPSTSRDISLTQHVHALHAGSKKRAHIAARYALKPKSCKSMYDGSFYNGSGTTEYDEYSVLQEDYDLDKRLELKPEEIADLDLLPPKLMKKFIGYARQNVYPLLNEASMNTIKRHFLEICNNDLKNEHRQIGMGQLLGLIALSKSRARLDLSNIVTPLHVRDVIALLAASIAQTSLGIDKDEASSILAKRSHLQ